MIFFKEGAKFSLKQCIILNKTETKYWVFSLETYDKISH